MPLRYQTREQLTKHESSRVLAAVGMIYVPRQQAIRLIETIPKAYVDKGRIEKVPDLRNAGPLGQKGLLDWNMPVIAPGRMLIRIPTELICDIRDPKVSGKTPR